jgi:hypothetical protein
MNSLKSGLLTLAASLLAFTVVSACPFCLSPPQTFSAQFLLADFVAIAELHSFEVLQQGTLPVATFRLQELLSGDVKTAVACGIRAGGKVIRHAEAGGKPGDLYLLYGDLANTSNKPSSQPATGTPATFTNTPVGQKAVQAASLSTAAIEWTDHTGISSTTAEYLRTLPRQELPVPDRLAWFVKHLESSDPAIAGDAWAEFGIAAYEDVKRCRKLYSPTRLRSWIADPNISSERLGLYGLMLGLCGQPADAEFLRSQLISGDTGEFRFGAEGLLAGYLLLTGEAGLAATERQFLQPQSSTTSRHALLQTLDFFHTYEPALIPRSRICLSARKLLEDPVLAEMTIMSLSRWQDWQSMEILEQLFNESLQSEEDNSEPLQRCILQFAQHCSRAGYVGVGPELPQVDPIAAECSRRAERLLKRVSADLPGLLQSPRAVFQGPSP